MAPGGMRGGEAGRNQKGEEMTSSRSRQREREAGKAGETTG